MEQRINGRVLKRAKMGDGLSLMSASELFIIGAGVFGFVGSDPEIVATGFLEYI